MERNDKRTRRVRRHHRVRAKLSGSTDRPRLAVFRSLKHISAQLIDDTTGRTLASASDRDLQKSKKTPHAVTVAIAQEVGKKIAQRAKAAGIERAVFDRGGHAFHGQVKAVAEGARNEGLTI